MPHPVDINSELASLSAGKWGFFVTVTTHSISTHCNCMLECCPTATISTNEVLPRSERMPPRVLFLSLATALHKSTLLQHSDSMAYTNLSGL